LLGLETSTTLSPRVLNGRLDEKVLSLSRNGLDMYNKVS
jgi:hypothetical protein